MKFKRLGEKGQETPCLVDEDGTLRDVTRVARDIDRDTIPLLGDVLDGVDPADLPVVDAEDRRTGPPIAQPANIFCIGLNYSDHAAETGATPPDEPILFNKAAAAFSGPNDPIPHVDGMSRLDWEVELGVVIGRRALGVSKDDALDHVFGYVLVNDVSEREWQTKRSGQWTKGKSFPNFCPTGPVLVTPDELGDPGTLEMWLDVNGERRQSGTTATMIFDVATIVSHLSHFMALEPGDLICTGTPPGVGMGMTPPQYLRPGDVVTLGIEGLSEARQKVVATTRDALR